MNTSHNSTSQFATLPDILVIQLDRFNTRNVQPVTAVKYNETQSVITHKIQQHVQFNTSLNLSQFVNTELQHTSEYKLYAVIEHTGSELSDGHYFAYFYYNDEWYQLNDLGQQSQLISKVTWEYVSSRQAYMLFYVQNQHISVINIESMDIDEKHSGNDIIQPQHNLSSNECTDTVISNRLKYIYKLCTVLTGKTADTIQDLVPSPDTDVSVSWSEMTGTSITKLIETLTKQLYWTYQLNKSSKFLDIGSGFGRVLFHVMTAVPMKQCVGIECVLKRAQLSNEIRSCLLYGDWPSRVVKLPDYANDFNVRMNKDMARCYIYYGNITTYPQLIYNSTHVYMCDTRFTAETYQHILPAINQSNNVKVVISVRHTHVFEQLDHNNRPTKVSMEEALTNFALFKPGHTLTGSATTHIVNIYYRIHPYESDTNEQIQLRQQVEQNYELLIKYFTTHIRNRTETIEKYTEKFSIKFPKRKIHYLTQQQVQYVEPMKNWHVLCNQYIAPVGYESIEQLNQKLQLVAELQQQLQIIETTYNNLLEEIKQETIKLYKQPRTSKT